MQGIYRLFDNANKKIGNFICRREKKSSSCQGSAINITGVIIMGVNNNGGEALMRRLK